MASLIALVLQVVTLALVFKIAFNDLRHVDRRLDELERIMGKRR